MKGEFWELTSFGGAFTNFSQKIQIPEEKESSELF